MRTIVIAMDSSENSLYAFKQYAEKFHQDDNYVIAAHCVHYTITNPEELITSKKDEEKIRNVFEEDEKRILSVLNDLEALLAEKKISGEVVRLEGQPGTSIIAKAEEVQAAMIVMGSRGLGTIRRTILGSVSEYILHHSHIPVMICKIKS